MEKIENVKNVGIFKNCIYNAIPLVFDESLSYYETLCALLGYLEKEIKPVINNNAKALEELQDKFIELQNYVDHYFDNLDVQEEINNKLDDMAESGELAEFIAQYLQLAGILVYQTIDDLANAQNIIEGSICKTLGALDKNDLKGGYYIIRQLTSSDVVDNFNIVALDISDTLIAERIKEAMDIKGESFENKVFPTQMSFNRTFYKFDKYYTDENPQVALISEHSPQAPNMFSHNPYGMYIETTAKGSENIIPNKGTEIGLLVNSVIENTYIDDDVTKPDYQGSVIGIAGFAKGGTSNNNSVVCGLWSYATTPTVTSEQFALIPSKTSTFGIEINIEMQQPNNSYMQYVSPGAVVGLFINNYKEPSVSQERQLYDFGIALNGSPLDGDYTKLGTENYHGYRTGILIDKIENYGISFGQYLNNNTTCIDIPNILSFENTHPDVLGISLGDSRMNYGDYKGSTFNNGDIWRNNGTLYYRENNTNHNFILTDKAIGKPLILGQETTGVYPNNSIWVYNNNIYFKDNSGTTHQVSFNN